MSRDALAQPPEHRPVIPVRAIAGMWTDVAITGPPPRLTGGGPRRLLVADDGAHAGDGAAELYEGPGGGRKNDSGSIRCCAFSRRARRTS